MLHVYPFYLFFIVYFHCTCSCKCYSHDLKQPIYQFIYCLIDMALHDQSKLCIYPRVSIKVNSVVCVYSWVSIKVNSTVCVYSWVSIKINSVVCVYSWVSIKVNSVVCVYSWVSIKVNSIVCVYSWVSILNVMHYDQNFSAYLYITGICFFLLQSSKRKSKKRE